jgi:hypothetical protein
MGREVGRIRSVTSADAWFKKDVFNCRIGASESEGE